MFRALTLLYLWMASRTALMSRVVTGAALLPHVVLMKVSTCAISVGVSVLANAVIFCRLGPCRVLGEFPPSVNRRISEVVSALNTAGLPASIGYLLAWPSP